MPAKEAKARVKINKMLEEADWRFFDSAQGRANVALEPSVKITQTQIDVMGENFDTVSHGFIDFLLLDDKGFPLAVLEAKSEDKNPLVGKEQARKYAKAQNCRFVLLSNGNIHYLWDLQQGSPHLVSAFPTPDSLTGYSRFEPHPEKLTAELVERDYIVLTQLQGYASAAGYVKEAEQEAFVEKNRLRFLRPYQIRAVEALQKAVQKGHDRFLFEMATGTGKTLTSAAVIKLFLRTGNARRVLFLVDRLELEDQANKAFTQLLKNDYRSVIYKEKRDDWRKAEIVVTTVQSLMFNSKYKTAFSPTDFDLVISDEAHRSISGDARAVFEYFVGYKLGLTATPRDYLRRWNAATSTIRDPRELERRHLLDTYKTFGCDSGEPTFRYSLLDGVRDGFLINPVVVDARTDITTQLLSEEGYAVVAPSSEAEGEDAEETFAGRDFEKKFFSEPTNRIFCETFLKNALRDPLSGEIGKSLVFAVSQHHAAKLTQMLNELADTMFPGKYQSDFAVQVTSQISDAQQFTINFTNNNLSGSANFLDGYKTSKTRVCVTVGMMTTGYDCPDLLNLALMRPIFSPSEFVQIKGRGTRKHRFTDEWVGEETSLPRVLGDLSPRFAGVSPEGEIRTEHAEPLLRISPSGETPRSREERSSERSPSPFDKTQYKLFDFFANCEYFEEKFQYDESLALPRLRAGTPATDPLPPTPKLGLYENVATDPLKLIREDIIGPDGMKIDRMLFQKFEETVKDDPALAAIVEADHWEQAVSYVTEHVLDKPTEYFTLEKLRRAVGLDRRLSLREMLELVFGRIGCFKSKSELLDDEFRRFVAANGVEEVAGMPALEYFFKAYLTDAQLRQILDSGKFGELNTHPTLGMADYKAVPEPWRKGIPEYIKDYVSLNSYM